MDAKLFVEGYQIDIDPDTNIPLNLQVVDVKDLNKRVGDFTKTITVSGTKNNNKILGNAFNLQIAYEDTTTPNVQQNFNPKRKARALLQSNNIAFSEGYIQLRNIKKRNDKIDYDIVFYGRLSDIITEIAGKEVSELDMSNLNHTISRGHIVTSWSDSNFDYIYPFVDYGHSNIRAHGEVNIGHLKPAIKLKRYIDQIFEEAGFTYDAPFFESNEFNNLYIPYNGVEDNVLTDEERRGISSVATNGSPAGIEERFPADSSDFASRGIKRYDLTDDVLGTGYLTSPPIIADQLYQFIAPETRLYNLSFNALATLEMQYVGTNSEQGGDPFEVRDHNVGFKIEIYDSNDNLVTGLRDKNDYIRTVTDLDDDAIVETTGNPQAGTFNIAGASERRAKFSRSMVDRSVVKEHEFSLQFTQLELQEGDRVKIMYDYYADFYDYGSSFFQDTAPTDVRISRANTTRTWNVNQAVDQARAWLRIEPDTYFEVEPIRGQLKSFEIPYEDFVIQEVQQKDLLLSTLKLFNLVAVPDSTNPRNLIIRERDQFFEDGDILDWDGKVDISREQSIQPVRDSDVRRWVYTWAEGKDFYSNLYRNLEDREYGDVKISNNSEFGKGDKKNVDIIFEPTVVVKYENSNVLDLVVEFPLPYDKARLRVDNTDDIELITGVGQQITIVINGTSYDRTIVRTEGTDLTVDSPITVAERGKLYGCVIKNRYDRLSIPSYKGKEDNVGQEPVETNPKLLYYSGTKACQDYDVFDGITTTTRDIYPIVHHLNAHPDDNPTFDYNFGQPRRVYFNINNYPENNIYKQYHQQTLQEILDGSNILTVHLNTSNTDVVNLQYNDKLFIEGQLYRVNKVVDFNLNKKQPTKFELIKL